jgi:tetratricopeptide (TPR) repeat protein
MKAEHRHELKTNALADSLNRLLQNIKAGPSRHGLLLTTVVAGVLIVAIIVYFLWRTGRQADSARWVKVDEAQGQLDDATNNDEIENDLKEFDKLADQNAGTLQARVLRFDRARGLFRRGLESLYSDHDKAIDDLKQARDAYAKLASESTGEKEATLAQEALMNVAKADESLGDLDAALSGYQKLASTYPNSVLGKAAAERVKYLEDPGNRARAKQLYDKLGEMTKPETKPAETPGTK